MDNTTNPITGDASLGSLFSQMQESTGKQADIAQEKADTLKPMREDISKDLNFKPGAQDMQSQMQAMPTSPSPVDKKSFMAFAGMAMVFAALAGKSTRTPTLTGLGAFASGIQGFSQGAHDKFRTDIEKWHADTQVALASNQQAIAAYSAVLEDHTLNLKQKTTQMQLKAQEFDDQMMVETIKMKGLEGTAKFIIDRQKAGAKLSKEAQRIKEHFETQSFRRFEFVEKQKDKALKPLDEMQLKTSKVKQLLATNSAAADKQVNALLTDTFDRTRATNLLFKENANFGSIYDRLAGHISSAFTGRYKIEDRQAIAQMMDDMEKNVISPSRQRIDKHYRVMSNNLDLDPNMLDTQDFYHDEPVGLPGGTTKPNADPAAAAAAYLKGK